MALPNLKKIAIHNRPNSFSDRWISYCDGNHLDYKMVDCLNSDIMNDLENCSILLWHWHHGNYADQLIARHVLKSAELMGLKTFPGYNTCWSYDDKIAQKYLLESVNAPLVPTHVFFNKRDALQCLESMEFPKVFKLRRGAGSQNVKLVRDKNEGKKLIHAAFGRGFKVSPTPTADTIKKLQNRPDKFALLLGKIQRLPRSLKNLYRTNKYLGREKGYVYFQDFVPDNQYDTRITIIGSRAFGFTRNVRQNDFRASGSGSIDYSLERISLECVKIAFQTAEKLKSQSLALDFVANKDGNPQIVEISYCYQAKAVYDCSGYWDQELNWHEGHMWPQDAIIQDILCDHE